MKLSAGFNLNRRSFQFESWPKRSQTQARARQFISMLLWTSLNFFAWLPGSQDTLCELRQELRGAELSITRQPGGESDTTSPGPVLMEHLKLSLKPNNYNCNRQYLVLLNDLWYHSYVHGVPEKTLVCVQRLLEALKNELEIRIGWVLKNSGNF